MYGKEPSPPRPLAASFSPATLATYAELHASLGHLGEARAFLDRALEQQTAPAERSLLRRKRAGWGRDRGGRLRTVRNPRYLDLAMTKEVASRTKPRSMVCISLCLGLAAGGCGKKDAAPADPKGAQAQSAPAPCAHAACGDHF